MADTPKIGQVGDGRVAAVFFPRPVDGEVGAAGKAQRKLIVPGVTLAGASRALVDHVIMVAKSQDVGRRDGAELEIGVGRCSKNIQRPIVERMLS